MPPHLAECLQNFVLRLLGKDLTETEGLCELLEHDRRELTSGTQPREIERRLRRRLKAGHLLLKERAMRLQKREARIGTLPRRERRSLEWVREMLQRLEAE